MPKVKFLDFDKIELKLDENSGVDSPYLKSKLILELVIYPNWVLNCSPRTK